MEKCQNISTKSALTQKKKKKNLQSQYREIKDIKTCIEFSTDERRLHSCKCHHVEHNLHLQECTVICPSGLPNQSPSLIKTCF